MKTLGEKTVYPTEYTSSILERVDRQHNRTGIEIDSNNLPFTGYDVWHAYEISFLLTNGVPVSAIAKLVTPCESKYLVESKSLKLYFNSFNMERLAPSVADGIAKLKEIVSKDLSELLECIVTVDFHTSQATTKYSNESICIDGLNQDISEITSYTENPEVLQVHKQSTSCSEKLFSTLLKSNCKVTGQPDWGNVFIAYKSSFQLDHPSLLKYIISFREENHFHEEIVETMYKRLFDLLNPEELTVIAYYTRRGGIDINPCRTSDLWLVSKQFLDSSILEVGQFRQ